MSHIFVELWTERPEWRALDAAGRAAFMERVAAAVAPVLAQDIACIAASALDGAPWRYIAVWRAANEAVITALRQALGEASWHEFFNQQDLTGAETTLEAILARHASDVFQ